MRLTIPGRPVPKARARVVNGHAFTPQRTKDHELLIRQYALVAGIRPIVGPVKLHCRFYMPDNRRVDGDNLQKLVADALMPQAYADDSQIVEADWIKILDRLKPRTVIEITSLGEKSGAPSEPGAPEA